MRIKRWGHLILAVLMLTNLQMPVMAQNPIPSAEIKEDLVTTLDGEEAQAELSSVASGKCGESLLWELTGTSANGYTLKFTGSGSMQFSDQGIPWYVYRGDIVNIELPSGVDYITDQAFKECTRLESVTIPGSVKIVGQYAFRNCTKLETVKLSNGIEQIQAEAFEGCS